MRVSGDYPWYNYRMNLPPVPMPLNPFAALPDRAVLASDEPDRLFAELGQTNTERGQL